MYGYGMVSFYIWLILLSDPLSCGYSNCPSVIRPTWKPGWGSACRLSIDATDVYNAVVKGSLPFLSGCQAEEGAAAAEVASPFVRFSKNPLKSSETNLDAESCSHVFVNSAFSVNF